ncbi:hypothetical protein ACFVRD_44895, partial [Streptomyces sp. NPDC057908]|uniref:hypothetical protein n=1 Tax=Streptomyces sp. NPDC057908 TaxID=3346276 RepID=UPI0036E399EB
DGSTVSTSVTLLLVIDASSMIGSYTERFTVPGHRACGCTSTLGSVKTCRRRWSVMERRGRVSP